MGADAGQEESMKASKFSESQIAYILRHASE
jgi:hypothetical protein